MAPDFLLMVADVLTGLQGSVQVSGCQIFRRIGIDPAISSGPLVTMANDALGSGLYYLLALFFLRALSG